MSPGNNRFASRVAKHRILFTRLAFASVVIALAMINVPRRVAAAPLDPASVVAIESATLDHPLRPRASATLRVVARVADGWHINADRPLETYYIATRLIVTPPAQVRAGAVVYPPAQLVTLAFAGHEQLAVFGGKVDFTVPLAADARWRGDVGAPAKIALKFQACNDRQCLRPATVGTTIDLASTASGAAVANATSTANASATSDNDAVARIFANHGYGLGSLVVLLGGLALNLTPCVYPLMGVTIAYFGNEGGGPRRIVTLALLYVLGIALMFSAVGVAVALSGGLFGAALQNPYVLGAIAAMLLILAASSFGMFTLQPPQWIMRRAAAARPGYAGSLVMGLGMGVVAAPCIGPIVLGLLLMVQRSGSAIFGFLLFFTLAVGMGLPYVGLALAAGSIRRLPRSGEWLAWIEQLFGFVLVGLALYFLDPIVPHRLVSRILPLYAAAVGIYLGFIAHAGRNWRPFVIFRSAIGIASAIALVYLALQIRSGPPAALAFQPFSPVLLQTAREAHQPVVVDFSADWCVPCREMERTTFVDPAVLRAAAGFTLLRANLTAESPANQGLIKQFNILGVPTTVFIDASGNIRKRRVGYVGPAEFLNELRADG
jgi:thioredoxin:protein disulfide reductase